MKRSGLLTTIALAAALTVACNSNGTRNNTAANNTAGENTVGTAGENANAVSSGDRDFIEKQAVDGMAEVELGKLAQQKATNPEVKRFAEMMVADHTKANDDLKQVASRFGVTLPTALDDKHRDLHDRLSKLSGADFDREYMSAMVDGHQDVAGDLDDHVDKDKGKTVSNTTTHENITPGAAGTTGQNDRARADNDKPAASATREITRDKTDRTDVAYAPKHDDNAASMAVNQWAANVLPKVEMHLDEAKQIHDRLDSRKNSTTRR